MALHSNNCPPCPFYGGSCFSAIGSAETSLTQKREECGQGRRTDFQQAEQTWLWRQGRSVYMGNKADVHTWGFCGTWVVAQSTKSWSWESLWRPFAMLGNFKEYHHNSENPPKCRFTLFFCLSIVLAVPWERLQPSHCLGEGVGCSRCAHLDHLLLTHQAPASLWLWFPQDISGSGLLFEVTESFRMRIFNYRLKLFAMFRLTSKLCLLLFGG